jgi:hypothetical protein
MKSYINITKNPSFYKHKVYKHTDDRDITWFEVVYFTNYGTSKQEIIFKQFDTVDEADKFCKMKINLIK